MPEVKASTQEHLDIYAIDEDLVLLKNGAARMVLQTTAINFDLLFSPEEQDQIIAAYSGLLNSLSFPIQVLVRSKRMDISEYIEKIRQAEKEQSNKIVQKRIESYRDYVESLVSKNEVLDKRFYIVIPHQEIVLDSPQSPLSGLFGGKKAGLNKSAILKKAKIQLEPKRDHIIKQLSAIGIRARQLANAELVQLYYDIYHPERARVQHLRFEPEEYAAPIVRPAIAR